MLSEKAMRKALLYLLFSALVVAGAWLFFRYLFEPLLPFLLAYGIAWCLQPLLRNKTGWKKRVLCLLSVCGIVVFLCAVCVLLFVRIREELFALADTVGCFLTRLKEDPDFAARTVDEVCGMIPFLDLREALGRFVADLDGQLLSLLGTLADRLSGSVLPFLAGVAAFLPNALLSVAAVLLSSYYFAVDLDRIHATLRTLLPANAKKHLQAARTCISSAAGSFVRAYGVLLLLTFSELFAAFLLFGYRYAFLPALFIALVDILPVLGTGTVLIPWGIGCLLFGSTANGVRLLLLYLIITVVRQIVEPRIVGKYIGLPPLLSLASMYLGLRLLGFWGLFLFPPAALLCYRYGKQFLSRKADRDPE